MSKYREMLKFNEDEYRKSTELIIEAYPIAKKVADEISVEGYENIFFSAVGGSLAPMMAIGEIAKQITKKPIFIEQAAELLTRGHKSLSNNSILITLSKSGDTKETVAMAKYAKENGIRVISLTKELNSPLALNSKSSPLASSIS